MGKSKTVIIGLALILALAAAAIVVPRNQPQPKAQQASQPELPPVVVTARYR